MNHDEEYSSEYLATILKEVKTIAMVGASATWKRPSFFAMKYLLKKGYRVVPINPRSVGTEIIGRLHKRRRRARMEPRLVFYYQFVHDNFPVGFGFHRHDRGLIFVYGP